jgi:hypothetical protein
MAHRRVEKNYAKKPSEMKPLVFGRGACFATDRITVDGCRVGYCYRQKPDNDMDSGWRFMAGDEDETYMSTLANLDVYDVNTIANFDPDIVALLDSPAGSSFVREPRTGKFIPDDQ